MPRSKWHWESAWQGTSSVSYQPHIPISVTVRLLTLSIPHLSMAPTPTSPLQSTFLTEPLTPNLSHQPDWTISCAYSSLPLTDWDLLEGKTSSHASLCPVKTVRQNLPCPKGHYQVEESSESILHSCLHLSSKTGWEMWGLAFSCLRTLLSVGSTLGCAWDRRWGGGVGNLRAFPVGCPSQVLGVSCLGFGYIKRP